MEMSIIIYIYTASSGYYIGKELRAIAEMGNVATYGLKYKD